eukprot:COSAG01_NODE_1_length_100484_cov_170.446142_14_plen_680_part_00
MLIKIWLIITIISTGILASTTATYNSLALRYFYQDDADRALQALKQQIVQQKFIHASAWVIPSLIAQQQNKFQPRVLTLKHEDPEIQALYDALKIQQLLLGNDIKYAELIYQKLAINKAANLFLVKKATLDILEKKIDMAKDLLSVKQALKSMLLAPRDPLIYANALRLKVKLQLTGPLKKSEQVKRIMYDYAELISFFPEQDSDHALWAAIQSSLQKQVPIDRVFRTSTQRLRYLKRLFRTGQHKNLQKYGLYLLRHKNSHMPLITDIKLILGLSYYSQLQLDEAIEMLREVKESPLQFQQQQTATFFLAKCYESLGQSEHAKSELLDLDKKKFKGIERTEALNYELCRLSKDDAQIIDYHRYRKRLKKTAEGGYFWEKLMWEEQLSFLRYAKDDAAAISSLEKIISNKELAAKVIQAYQDLQAIDQIESLGAVIGLYPLRYSDLLSLNSGPISWSKSFIKWEKQGFRAWAMAAWRYQENLKGEADIWHQLVLTKRELDAYQALFTREQPWWVSVSRLPKTLQKMRYTEKKWQQILEASEDIDEAYVFLAANHPESQRYFNHESLAQGFNPKQSQLLTWVYRLDYPLLSIHNILPDEKQVISHAYFQKISQAFKPLVYRLITLKSDVSEAERVKTHGPFNDLSYIKKWIEDEESASFVESVMQKVLLYRILKAPDTGS